mgnify:CR=1 FL=1
MLTISTIPEALAELDKRTGRAWTDSELFDVATRYGIELHAAPPTGAKTTIEKHIDGVGLVETIPRLPRDFDYLLAPYVNTNHAARLAVLFPAQVEQLWLSGEVFTRHSHLHNEVEDETIVFFEPVRVTREQVRIKAATLQKILGVWDKAQAGEGRRYKGPEWMFITQQTAPEQSPAEPAPVVLVAASPAPKNKSQTTLIFEAKVIELMGKFWNDRTPGTEPTKGELCKLVYQEILRTGTRGKRKTTQGMVNDAAKPWKAPLVLPTLVRDSQFNEKRHPFKGDK